MAVNAGDMLYYDGSKWVNSSKVETADLILDVSDSGTSTVVYAAQLRHTTSKPGSVTVGYGVGLQFFGSDLNGDAVQIGTIECAQANPVLATSVQASFHKFIQYDGSGNSIETLRLGSEGGPGSTAAAFFRVPLLGRAVPFQLNYQPVDLAGGGIVTMTSGQYQSPILEMYDTNIPSTVVFPTAWQGAFWIVHNATTQPLTLTNDARSSNYQTIAAGKRAMFYMDAFSTLQRATPDT